jgi:coenzyme F420 hydrogenase subunit beta
MKHIDTTRASRSDMNTIADVVDSGLCIGCGLCAYSDAIKQTRHSVKAAQSIPVITDANRNDQFAFAICPGKGYKIIEEGKRLYETAKYDLHLGYSYKEYVAFSNDRKVLANASSGGIMSHIAIYLLDQNIVDRVLTTYFSYGDEPRTVCTLAASRNDILRSQGSKYCPVDLSESIREIKANGYRVAVIGTPCQIAGVRNIQRLDPSFNDKIVITIGNFCGGIKSYKNINLLAERHRMSPASVRFFRFRGGGQPGSLQIEDDFGRQIERPYPKYVGLTGVSKHLRCHLCVDATAELADIACGDAWLPRFLQDANPWSIILTRSKKADDLICDMIRRQLITIGQISQNEIRFSQRENLHSKKVRQNSRYYLYRMLGFQLPFFDGGYADTEIRLWTELKIFCKHRAKQLLERLHLFPIIYKLLKHS